MRFSVVGVSNEKSIFSQSYSIGHQFKLQNEILESHVALAKKNCTHWLKKPDMGQKVKPKI